MLINVNHNALGGHQHHHQSMTQFRNFFKVVQASQRCGSGRGTVAGAPGLGLVGLRQ